MPAANEYIDNPNSPESRNLDEIANAERANRAKFMERNWRYYLGDMPEPLKGDGSRVNDNVLFPKITQIIDKGLAGMMGVDDYGDIDGIKFEVVRPDQPQQSTMRRMLNSLLPQPMQTEDAAQQWLDEFWRVNKKNQFLHKVMLNAGLTGHPFVQIRPGELQNEMGELFPRLVNLNPSFITVFWAADDVETVLWYRIETDRKRTDYINLMDSWLIRSYERQHELSTEWAMRDEINWVYSFAPIVDWQNIPVPSIGGYYGRDDVGTLYRLNDSLNFTASNIQRITKHHTAPKTVITGGELPRRIDNVTGDEYVDIRPDGVLEFLSPDTRVTLLEMSSEGAVAYEFLQLLEREIFNGAREVDPATVADKLGDLTNFGLRVMFQDTLAKRQSKWLGASDGLRQICRSALYLGGFANMRVRVVPPEVLPVDDREQVEALRTDVEVFGVSVETAQRRRGYDPDTETDQRFDANRRQAVGTRRQELQRAADEALAFGG